MNLYEEIRPKCFEDVVGQDEAISRARSVLARGWGGRAWWLSGLSGTGKTTIARIIAAIGADEFFTVEYKAGDDVSIKDMKSIERQMWTSATGKGGRAFIINEAHGLHRPVIRYLLGVLEDLPERSCFIFTTTAIGQRTMFDEKIDAHPLLSRCVCLELTTNGLAEVFARYCKEAAADAGLNGKSLAEYVKLAMRCKSNCREMLMKIESGEML